MGTTPLKKANCTTAGYQLLMPPQLGVEAQGFLLTPAEITGLILYRAYAGSTAAVSF